MAGRKVAHAAAPRTLRQRARRPGHGLMNAGEAKMDDRVHRNAGKTGFMPAAPACVRKHDVDAHEAEQGRHDACPAAQRRRRYRLRPLAAMNGRPNIRTSLASRDRQC